MLLTSHFTLLTILGVLANVVICSASAINHTFFCGSGSFSRSSCHPIAALPVNGGNLSPLAAAVREHFVATRGSHIGDSIPNLLPTTTNTNRAQQQQAAVRALAANDYHTCPFSSGLCVTISPLTSATTQSSRAAADGKRVLAVYGYSAVTLREDFGSIAANPVNLSRVFYA